MKNGLGFPKCLVRVNNTIRRAPHNSAVTTSAQEKMLTFSKAFGCTTVSGGPVGPKSEDAGTTPSLEGPPEAAVLPPAASNGSKFFDHTGDYIAIVCGASVLEKL